MDCNFLIWNDCFCVCYGQAAGVTSGVDYSGFRLSNRPNEFVALAASALWSNWYRDCGSAANYGGK